MMEALGSNSRKPDYSCSGTRIPSPPAIDPPFGPTSNMRKLLCNSLGFLFLYRKLRNGALKCLQLCGKKEKVVIVIGEGGREDFVNLYDDDSSVEEFEIIDVSMSEQMRVSGTLNAKEPRCKMFEEDSLLPDYSVINSVNASVTPSQENLYDLTKMRDDELRLYWDIVYNLQELGLSRPQKIDKQDWIDECFAPLTDEEGALVAQALYNSNGEKVLASHDNSNIDITGEKLQCLRPGEWLNDEVINFYLYLLKEREQREPQKFLKCHFFNTFFYKKLISGINGYNFQAVRRWTTQRKLGYQLLDCEKIFVPIHKGNHWCLAMIDKKDNKFAYLDSLKGSDSQVMSVLPRYYVDEVKDKTGEDIDVSSWEHQFVTNPPEQENGYDCGMFMIKYIDFYSRDIGLWFNQSHMPYFRERTAKEILKLKAG